MVWRDVMTGNADITIVSTADHDSVRQPETLIDNRAGSAFELEWIHKFTVVLTRAVGPIWPWLDDFAQHAGRKCACLQ